ncbi:MAG: tRNA pseudouridine(38-40) synthase TruA [Cyclobacteriaceae bacterium]
MRYFLDLSYLGTAYHGWQIQKNAHSVQAETNRALSTYLREEINVTGSGRTDTGVHARQQIVHFDIDKDIDPKQLLFKLNALLPNDIAAKGFKPVIKEAHARFDAVKRSYQYLMHTRKTPFVEGLSYYFPHLLDIEEMNKATKLLLGKQNFQCFSKVKTEVNTFDCDINAAYWILENEKLVFHVSADRFLRGMVRAIVGTLLMVGERKMTLEDFQNVLDSRDRRKAGRSVPAHGLYLTEVIYPPETYI